MKGGVAKEGSGDSGETAARIRAREPCLRGWRSTRQAIAVKPGGFFFLEVPIANSIRTSVYLPLKRLEKVIKMQQGKQPTESEINRTAVSDMERTLSELGGEDQIVSPTEWNEARQVWIHAGYNPENFDSSFASQHINWGYNTEKYMLSPTYKKLVNPHGI